MWPSEVFETGGAEKLIEAARLNTSIGDPYSLISAGLNNPSVPYSRAYPNELSNLNQQLNLTLWLSDSPVSYTHLTLPTIYSV